MTLTEFLLARNAEREAIARAATPGPWRWDNEEFDDDSAAPCTHSSEWTDHGPDLVTIAGKQRTTGEGKHTYTWFEPDGTIISATGYDASSVLVTRANADHIARHDPTLILAECEAMRQIVALHTSDGGHECPAGFDRPGDSYVEYTHDCLTLRILASVYSDHPDYLPEWMPDGVITDPAPWEFRAGN